jgi:hypothetical protein
MTLTIAVAVIAILLQLLKHNGPIEGSAYLRVCFLIEIPNAIFVSVAALALGVFLRDRYLSYLVTIGLGAGLWYLYSQGHNHWLFNPLMARFWNYEILIGAPGRVVLLRAYTLALSLILLLAAHLAFRRPR